MIHLEGGYHNNKYLFKGHNSIKSLKDNYPYKNQISETEKYWQYAQLDSILIIPDVHSDEIVLFAFEK